MEASVRWRKSSYSGGDNECVEVAHTWGEVRDSKNPTGPRLAVRADGLHMLIAVVKANQLND